MPRIDLALIVCNDEEDRQKVVASALKCGLSPICCSNLEEARILLSQEAFRVVFCKENLADGDFLGVLREVKKLDSRTPVIVLSRTFDWDSYLKALGAGIFDCIACPPNRVEAERIIWLALANTIDVERASRAAA